MLITGSRIPQTGISLCQSEKLVCPIPWSSVCYESLCFKWEENCLKGFKPWTALAQITDKFRDQSHLPGGLTQGFRHCHTGSGFSCAPALPPTTIASHPCSTQYFPGSPLVNQMTTGHCPSPIVPKESPFHSYPVSPELSCMPTPQFGNDSLRHSGIPWEVWPPYRPHG